MWLADRVQPKNQREKLLLRLASCWKPEMAQSISAERDRQPAVEQPSDALDRLPSL